MIKKFFYRGKTLRRPFIPFVFTAVCLFGVVGVILDLFVNLFYAAADTLDAATDFYHDIWTMTRNAWRR